jgi:hypothetical protein
LSLTIRSDPVQTFSVVAKARECKSLCAAFMPGKRKPAELTLGGFLFVMPEVVQQLSGISLVLGGPGSSHRSA